MEAYRVKNDITQFTNCQKFGHTRVNSLQLQRCLWCGADHRHKKFQEKVRTPSLIAANLSRQQETVLCPPRKEKAAARRMRSSEGRIRRPWEKAKYGRSKYTNPEQSSAAALKTNTQQQQPPQRQPQEVRPTPVETPGTSLHCRSRSS